ncbi:DUF4248 domain-containing protein [Phocaeicola paurosaccharolyticus]|jgi:hypothetical protein|uniref:DUF4248 domain-containing protein n=1 Tax=Phocaeicola paurosaccharolyticus TaxID=732242 RepID=UPI002FE03669
MEEFKSKTYTKLELASFYCPGRASSHSTLMTFYRWINANEELCKELQMIGYNRNRHSFLKREVEVIVKYLGEPF